MYLALAIVYLIAACCIALAIVGTTVYTAITRRDAIISKKNLFYFAPIFLLLYAMLFTAMVYNGETLDYVSCFSLIGSTLEVLVKFKLSGALVSPICSQYPVYYAALVLITVSGCATAILSVTSFFSQSLRNGWKRHRLLRRGCDVVLGSCKDALRYAAQNRKTLLLLPETWRGDRVALVREGYTVLRGGIRALKRRRCGALNLIVFRESGLSYSKLIEELLEVRAAGCNAVLHLEAEQDEVKIIREKFIAGTDKRAQATINCFSKHELIARQFVHEHPITRYIPRSFYQPNYALKEGKEINVVFIGFGKMNYQLFRMFSMQFQFALEKEGRLQTQPVHYHVYDKQDAALHNEFFSRILFEMDADFQDCDFPAPEKICTIHVDRGDINSVAVRQQFRTFVTPNSFTYFVISLKGDLEDASYAQTVRRLLPEEGNYRIFVRAKNNTEALDGDEKIIFFGNESAVYTHEWLVNDVLSEMAKRIHMLYSDVGSAPAWLRDVRKLPAPEQARALQTALHDPARLRLMQEAWDGRPMIEQASNLYHALNLPFKLYLLGFAMVKRTGEGDEGVTEEQFLRRYVNSGREEEYRDLSFFFKTQPSNVLAFIEHARWNALYILYDYKQMKKADMRLVEGTAADGTRTRTLAHKDTERKLHACLTSYYGIKALIDWKYEMLYGKPAAQASPSDPALHDLYNLYEYDYMDLDRLYSEITAMGYKLIDVQQ